LPKPAAFLTRLAESAIVLWCKNRGNPQSEFRDCIGVWKMNGAFTNSFRWSNIKNSAMAKKFMSLASDALRKSGSRQRHAVVEAHHH
jgi:hypothetical protein